MFINEKTLLVVVDMQRDFVTGVLGSKEAVAIVDDVVKKTAEHQKVVFTFDTHEDNYLETQEGKHLPVKHCIADTDGHELIPELMVHKDRSYTVQKNTFGSVQLGLFVAAMFSAGEIDSVELVGVCTDICVISNAMLIKAYCPEIPMSVDAACCAGVTPESHTTALKAMAACQIAIKNVEGI